MGCLCLEPLAAQGDIYSIAEEFCEGVTVATSDDASGATPSKNVTPNCCTSRNGNLFSSSAVWAQRRIKERKLYLSGDRINAITLLCEIYWPVYVAVTFTAAIIFGRFSKFSFTNLI